MRRVKALSLLVVSFALCLLPYMTSAQAGVEMVLQVYNGGPVTMYAVSYTHLTLPTTPYV